MEKINNKLLCLISSLGYFGLEFPPFFFPSEQVLRSILVKKGFRYLQEMATCGHVLQLELQGEFQMGMQGNTTPDHRISDFCIRSSMGLVDLSCHYPNPRLRLKSTSLFFSLPAFFPYP